MLLIIYNNYLVWTRFGGCKPIIPCGRLSLPIFGLVFLFNLVILYSGLQNINGDLYEAAALDGCNAWQRFWKITFPLLKPVSMITLLLGFVYTLRTVDIIWIMTKGTGSSRTLATWAYEMAFGKGTSATIRYSEASVVGTILIVVALIFALIYLWAQRNEEKR